MVYKRFYIQVIVRILFILLNCIWLALEIATPPYIYTVIFLGSLLILQTYGLIRYVNKTNRELSRFFTSLKDKDSSLTIAENKKGGSFRQLADTMNETAALIRESRIEKEEQFRYLQFVVEHVGIGLIAFSNDGKVSLINKAAKKLLGLNSLTWLNQLNVIKEGFEKVLFELKPGEQTILKIRIRNDLLQVLIRVTGFKFQDKQLKLSSIQDFKQELEEKELESWQKLIRVMTHEIMNSVTPIATLTLAIRRCLSQDSKIKTVHELEEENLRDVVLNTDLIEERSKGLIGFVNNYRSISKIEKISISGVQALKLLQGISNLFREDLKKFNIRITQHVHPKELRFDMDEKLIQQVLINLVKNSIEAIRGIENARIDLKAIIEPDGTPVIQVTDNGQGIPETRLEDIFVPFFTTRKNGSGIGLSFSRQVMRLHKGSIEVRSEPGKETTFRLRF